MTYHLNKTSNHDEPNNDPGNPVCSTFLDVLMNNLKLACELI